MLVFDIHFLRKKSFENRRWNASYQKLYQSKTFIIYVRTRENRKKMKKHRKQDEKLKNSFNLPLTIKIALQQQNEKQ